jgi:hypothetical protein
MPSRKARCCPCRQLTGLFLYAREHKNPGASSSRRMGKPHASPRNAWSLTGIRGQIRLKHPLFYALHYRASNPDPLDFIERDFVSGPIVELRRARGVGTITA